MHESKRKILVIDSDDITNDIFKRLFSEDELIIQPSVNLQLISEMEPDVIIYDRDVVNHCIREFYNEIDRNNSVLIECTVDESNTSIGSSTYEPDARHYKPLSESIFKDLFARQYQTFIRKTKISNFVVIIDDNEHQRGRLKTLLEPDYMVKDFEDASVALNYLQHNEKVSPDLIILDIIMNKMNGFEFMVRLRDEISRDIPVLCLSSRKIGQFVKQAMALGASDYMYKPYNTIQLRNKVDSLIG